MEITKREIIASVIIVSLMLMIGLVISGKISTSVADQNEIYHKAIHIDEEELFRYAMKTNTGNAFVYGDLIAIDPVSYSELEGEYFFIQKIKERYTEHTRTVTYTDNNGKTKTKTETYWTWDEVGKETKQSQHARFLNVEFNANQFTLPSKQHITTIKESYYVRHKYYGIPAQLVGTIFSYLGNSNIQENVSFYPNMTANEAYDYLVSGGQAELIIFWIFWILLTSGLVWGFYYLENKWLY